MSTLTNTTKIDLANIGLMIFSCVISFLVPFELFLFSYAVLGPLHYLTEIGWLHKKGYFTKGKYDFIFLGLLAGLISLGALGFFESLNGLYTNFVYVAFISALIMVFIKDNTLKIAGIVLVIFSTIFFRRNEPFEIFFAIYLPTIIHVFLFTGFFILLGALKHKSASGITSLLVFIACALSFFMLDTAHFVLSSNEYIKEGLFRFFELNRQLVNATGLGNVTDLSEKSKHFLIEARPGIVVMRFIAFAYTYHYLNWFSKTSIIQWHRISRNVLIAIVAIWIISIALYIKSYDLGLRWLFFLSFLHVLLEFPLNFRSIVGIGQEVGSLFGIRKSPVK